VIFALTSQSWIGKSMSNLFSEDINSSVLCLGVDGKIDKNTLYHDSVQNSDKVMKRRRDKQHSTFVNESRKSRSYLTHSFICLHQKVLGTIML